MKTSSRWTLPILVVLMAACAQQPVYTAPYVSAPAIKLDPPLAVTLAVTYRKDGKRDAARERELTVQLRDALSAGQAFKPVDAGADAVGALSVDVEDAATTKHRSLLGTFSASLGNLMLGQAEFTPQGRRTPRALDVDVSYTPMGSSGRTQSYTNLVVTITNNTQEPTDLVPMSDRKQAELTLIGNDLNLFAAELAKPQDTPKP